MLNSKGKQILKSSYSALQDDYFQHMRSAGYLDAERGERFSTEEHLTITQFKVLAEKERLEAVAGQGEQAEQCDALKRCAITGIAAKAENSQLRQKLTAAEKAVAYGKQQYETLHKKYQTLKKKAQPYLDALEIASEKVRAFIDSLLARGKQEQKRTAHKRGQEFDIQ